MRLRTRSASTHGTYTREQAEVMVDIVTYIVCARVQREVDVHGARPPALLLSAVGARGHRRRG